MRFISLLFLCILFMLFTGTTFANEAPSPGTASPPAPSPIVPTVGRTVLARVRDTNGRPKEVPLIVTDVHSDSCVSGIGLSTLSVEGVSVEGVHPGGTIPLTSLPYSEDDSRLYSWRWMPVQSAGGGFAARIEALEDHVGLLDEAVSNIALTTVMKAPEDMKEPEGKPIVIEAGSQPMENPHA